MTTYLLNVYNGHNGHINCIADPVAHQVSQLVEEVQRLQTAHARMRDSSTSQIAKLEEELSVKARLASGLEVRIASQHDYTEIRRELEYVSLPFRIAPIIRTSFRKRAIHLLIDHGFFSFFSQLLHIFSDHPQYSLPL